MNGCVGYHLQSILGRIPMDVGRKCRATCRENQKSGECFHFPVPTFLLSLWDLSVRLLLFGYMKQIVVSLFRPLLATVGEMLIKHHQLLGRTDDALSSMC
eukprot:scaffold4949_cov134-Cylindrotheca_fusiformis.AAC.3